REVLEGMHILGATTEIEQQNVLALDRPLDASNQDDPSLPRVRDQRFDRELLVVQRDGQCVKPEDPGVIDQLLGGVRDAVARVVGSMRMQVDLEHSCSLLKIAAAPWSA